MARESKPPDVDGARDYVAVFTPETEIDPERTCLVVVDMQYATGTRTTGLGKRLAEQGKLQDAEYRYARIEDFVLPNTKRLLGIARLAIVGMDELDFVPSLFQMANELSERS